MTRTLEASSNGPVLESQSREKRARARLVNRIGLGTLGVTLAVIGLSLSNPRHQNPTYDSGIGVVPMSDDVKIKPVSPFSSEASSSYNPELEVARRDFAGTFDELFKAANERHLVTNKGPGTDGQVSFTSDEKRTTLLIEAGKTSSDYFSPLPGEIVKQGMVEYRFITSTTYLENGKKFVQRRIEIIDGFRPREHTIEGDMTQGGLQTSSFTEINSVEIRNETQVLDILYDNLIKKVPIINRGTNRV